PPFLEWDSQQENRQDFRSWYEKYQPDVVLILYNGVIAWLEEIGLKIPEDIGVIQLEWRGDRPNIAGMDQHNNVTGEAVVDMIINQIHNNEKGVPKFPLSTLIGSSWIDGDSVRST
ncbi:MAG: LacI family transcriptional regulator, partial [Verrucomicrobiae bacterium]|nr:LacI family transcriptional regulator [Verrucomicrobiae bacterium]